MGKKLTFIRHGQTTSNLEKHFNKAEEPLNKEGQLQAQELGLKLEKQEFDLVLCSPLRRTKETASFLSETHKELIECWEELKEVDWGDCSGRPYIKGENAFQGLDKNRFGESLNDLENRGKAFWDRLNKRKEERILIVSHGAILCVLFAVRAGIKSDEFSRFRVEDWDFMGNCDQKYLEL